jgi:signal transduction histidine kinase
METKINNITCLIVDDDTDFASSICIFLEDLGLKPILLPNGSDALIYLNQYEVDLLLLDLMMPNLNGVEVIEELRKKDMYIPIIVISGTGSINLAVEAVKKGADDFISKPIVNFDQLELSIARVLDKAALISEVKEYRNNLESLVRLRTSQLEDKNVVLEQLNKDLEMEIKKRSEADEIIKKGTLNIISALEEERKRLATELHDSIGQKLMFSKLKLELVLKNLPSGSEAINSILEYLEQISIEIYSLIRSLYPAAIEKYPLNNNIDSLVRNFETTKQVKTNFFVKGIEHKLENDVKLNIYRVYQEALNNISKHSDPAEVTVTLEFGDSKISGAIENDGVKDIDDNSFGSGLGIFTMRERISKLNGKLAVDNPDKNRFRITFEVPV